ncbi:MAG: FKBP-type peptidyl-prolyl cis-trans isomerase, partial [Bacteroidota bacterium]
DEVVDVLKVGDSVSFQLPAEDLFEKTYGLALPDSIQKGTMLLFNMSLHSTMTKQEHDHETEEARILQQAKWEEEIQNQLVADVSDIDERLDAEGKKYLKMPSGLRMVINKKGKGRKPQQGEVINVHYEGRYFTNNEIFDKRGKDQEPLTFPLGSGVIDGWNQAFAEMTEGTSATLYIPSKLGYGSTQFYEIPPNSILVFDVDFVKIGK